MGQLAVRERRRDDAALALATQVRLEVLELVARSARARSTLTLSSAEGPGGGPDAGRPSDPSARGTGELILVADDDEQVRRMLVRALERGGYRVVAVSDGDAALAAFVAQRAEIRLVITDAEMPGMGGRELVQAIHGVAPEARVILATGNAQDVARDAQLGLSGHVSKPFVPAELLQVVRRALDLGPEGS